MATKKEVATASAVLPEEFADLEQFAGEGLDDLDAQDRSVPFLKVLEKNSPEVEDNPDAKPGWIIDTSTGELYESVRFVPATREQAFVEWVPVDDGGGLVASYTPTSDIGKWAAGQRGKIKLKNGNDLVQTFYLFGLLLSEDDSTEPKPVVMSFTSTRIRTYKTIVQRSDGIMLPRSDGKGKFKAPWFCHVWRIKTDKKVDGKMTWFVYDAAFDSEDGTAEGARLPANHPAVVMGSAMVQQKASGDLRMADAGAAGEQPETDAVSAPDPDAENPPF